MKKLFLFLTLAMASQPAISDEYHPFDHDKVLHLGGAAAYTFAVTKGLEQFGMFKIPAMLLASSSCLLLATSKEFYLDKEPSSGDFTADLIGIGLGLGFAYAIEF